MLRTVWPVSIAGRVALMVADYFLQKDYIGIESPQVIAQFVYNHASVEMRKSLMNIVSGYMQLIEHVMNGKIGVVYRM